MTNGIIVPGKFLQKTLSFLLSLAVLVSSFAPTVAWATDPPPPTLPNAQLFTSQSLAPHVDQTTGALVQRIPLDIPPGRNGLTPDLALTYNSQDLQDGIVGYGWSLSIPYIERLNKTGTEKLYTDNHFTSSWGGELASVVSTSTSDSAGISASSTLRAGLVSYYKFDEPNGVAYDATSTNNLTNNNTVAFSTGKINSAADFGSSNTTKYFSNPTALGMTASQNFTYNFWVKVTTQPSNGNAVTPIMWSDDATTNGKLYSEIQLHNNGGTLEAYIDRREAAAADQTGTAQTFTAGTWYMLTYTWDGSNHKLYVNGSGTPLLTQASTRTGTNTATGQGTHFHFGADTVNNRYLSGLEDEAGIWNRVLTASEISSLYNSGSGLEYSSGGVQTATTTNEYRHRIEDGRFIKYTYASSTWIAYDKNGTRYQFGATTQAQQFATTSTSTISRWMLEEVRDTNDNFIRYVYTRDGNQLYPSQIIYTGSGTTDGIFTIDLTKSARPDVFTTYKNAYKVTTSYRITEIQASVNGSWVRKYALSYGVGGNGARSVLTSIQETGRDDTSKELTLPALTFTYASSTTSYTSHTNQRMWNGARIAADADGNGLPDLNIFYQDYPSLATTGSLEKNQYPSFTHVDPSVPDYWGDDGLSWDPVYQPEERGVRFFDGNGDGKADVVRSARNDGGTFSRAYFNNTSSYAGGFSWASTTLATGTIPAFSYQTGSDVYSTGFFGNINGDGLIDYVIALPVPMNDLNGSYLHLATTTGWELATSTFTPLTTLPTGVSQLASQFVDINGDGLDDWVSSTAGAIEFCLNKGTSWDTSCVSGWSIATSSRHVNGWDRGIRFLDVNGDNLPDYVRAYTMPSYTSKIAGTTDIEIGTYNYIYLNTGSGWATSTLQMPEYAFIGHLTTTQWGGRIEYNEFIDWNGDGIPDAYGVTSTTTRHDLLTRIIYPTSGRTDVAYQYSSQLGTNPNLAFPVLVVTSIANHDNLGNVATTTYSYTGGETYTLNNILDRKFAGFETITENKGDTLTKSYYYQGNMASTTVGELTDGFPLIGRMYRKDVLASSTGAVYNRSFFNWNSLYQGNAGRYFVYLATTTEEVFDGDSTHRDTAVSYVYSTTTGDTLKVVQWGEVVASSTDGTFVDTGSDMATTSILYAASSSVNLSVPYSASTTNQSGTKINETRNYYDSQSLGFVTKGNRTKQESWISGSSYASTTRTYSSYGLVTQERDPRYNLTTYAYDTYNLYPATTTNALSQETGYLYDYATGKVRQTLDPNTRRTQTLFDPAGRVKEFKQPDLTTPTTLVTKSLFAYNDSWPVYVKQTDYLNAATSTDTYQYTDGFGRTYQTRKTAEDGNLVVQDFLYNSRSLLASSSLPYFSTGASSTSATSSSNLFTSYLYDPLDRATSIANAVGTTANTYDDWHTILTDARGKRKDFYKDAYGNLSQVIEHNSSTHGTTTYAYDLNKQLTSITDAAANVRNFTYDGLGRRLTAEDLHAAADTTFGTTTYSYDDAGNLTQQVDPKLQTVDFTYDALNRPLTENWTGGAGTELEYAYDTGSDGVGRLSGATTTDSGTNYFYSPLGKVSREVKTLENTQYLTRFDYDRLGNIASTTYPDGSQVFNTFNVAGLLEKIDHKPAGGAVTSVVADFDYAPHGQLAYQELANSVKTWKTYDSAGMYRLSNILTATTTVGTTTTIQNLTYTYDANGNITHIVNATSSTATTTLTYAYDDLNRLTSATTTVGGTGNGSIAYWPFDESSGVAYDSTSNHYDLTNNNTVAFSSGKVNNAADFGSSNTTKYHNNTSLVGMTYNDHFTQNIWINVTTQPANNTAATVIQWSDNTTANTHGYNDIQLYKNAGTMQVYIGRNNVTTNEQYGVNYTFTPGTWYMLTFTWDGSNEYLYINGSATPTVSGVSTSLGSSGSNGQGTNFKIGADTVNGRYFSGLTDEVGIWNRVLSTSEITALYNSGSGTGYSSGDTGTITAQTYSYDMLGNMTRKSDLGSYVYAGTSYANPHAVTDLASTTYAYDNSGNVTTAGTKLFSWNYRDRLLQVATGTATTTYAYDFLNQRVRQWIPTVGTTTYVGQWFDKIATSSQATTTSYIFANDILIATIEGNGNSTSTRYVGPDHLGSTNVVTNSNGVIVQSLTYNPYGSTLTSTSTDTSNARRQFIGQFTDSIANLSYLNARSYQADKGRFISQDPSVTVVNLTLLSDPQQLNTYSYGRDNPLTYKDTDGKMAELVTVYAGGTLGMGVHSYVLITNTPQAAAKLTGVPTNSDPTRITLGGYPVNKGIMANFGNMFLAANHGTDYTDNEKDIIERHEILAPREYRGNQTAYENALLREFNGQSSNVYPYSAIAPNIDGQAISNNVPSSVFIGAGVDPAIIQGYRPQSPNFFHLLITPGLGQQLPVTSSFVQRLQNLVSSLSEFVNSMRATEKTTSDKK